ncbi:MAG: tetratricopeptide repeat protein, partial [Gemmatimonadota bacterium]|nr:tetratricopeptide repeat protein [Gemmatimonadota bacterium]
LRRMGRSQAALESVEALLAKRPHDAALHLEAGVLHDLSGNPQAALRFMERAASLDPSLDEAVVSRAVVLARSGREEDAAQVLRAFLRARPGSSEAPRARDLLMRVEAEEAGSTRD